ncbi:hypothetical protein ACTXLS_10270 [Corynebacterium variabile]|uniref:hypothetical protein n=1 Tax=Corynebacterium variabile TaxID=1727 RepID=UPI003FD3A9FC
MSTKSDEVKQGVPRPSVDGGVADTAYAADISGALDTGKAGNYGINLDRFPAGTRGLVQVEYTAAG